MRIMLVGATGTLGRAISQELSSDCDIVSVANRSGDYQVDLADSASITALYQSVGAVDAVICAAAHGGVIKPVEQMLRQDFLDSMKSKLLGQIDLVTQGIACLGTEASFTLTTGLLNYQPIAKGAAAAMVNAAVEGFAHAAAIDMPARQRINVISPALLQESVEQYRGLFPGYLPVPAAIVAKAYRKAVLGRQNGAVIRVGW